MSKLVNGLIRKELAGRFQGVKSLAVVELTGIDGVATNQIRGQLRNKQICLTVVKNSIAIQAFTDVGLPEARELFDGPCAVVFGKDTENVGVVEVIREILDIRKEHANLTVKAALLDGEVFGLDRIDELSKYPTRDEAISRVLTCTLSPGAKLTASILAPGIVLGGLIKAIQESKTEESGDEAAA